MSGLSFSRIFAVSAFEALRLLRVTQVDHPSATELEIIEIIQQTRADGAANDFEAALHLNAYVPVAAPAADTAIFYRLCIEGLITAMRPVWIRTIPYGRQFFVQKLERDEAQCFHAAGLMEDIPQEDVVDWWDRIGGGARQFGELEKVARSRTAERMSLEFETKRLAKLGIDKQPKWIGFDDNRAGYDILSYDLGADGPVARLLEVKSTIASPLRFYVTRNEWEKCAKAGAAYHFHIWDMKTGNLFQKAATDIAPHIPNDNGRGKWSNVEIRVG